MIVVASISYGLKIPFIFNNFPRSENSEVIFVKQSEMCVTNLFFFFFLRCCPPKLHQTCGFVGCLKWINFILILMTKLILFLVNRK